MTHPTEDSLLAFALDVIDDRSERAAIGAHLRECAECAARSARIQGELGVIGGLQPRGRRLVMPELASRRRLTAMVLLRSAAMLLVGFALGMRAGERVHREPVSVAPAYVTLVPAPDSLWPYAVADGTEAGLASSIPRGR